LAAPPPTSSAISMARSSRRSARPCPPIRPKAPRMRCAWPAAMSRRSTSFSTAPPSPSIPCSRRAAPRPTLMTTAAFRDVYAIGRGNRPDAFNLFFHRPRPLVPRELTFEVAERMNAAGEVLVPIDPAAIEILGRQLIALGIEAVAVCFLHSYANPAHE